MKIIPTLILLLALISPAGATTYYVATPANGGSDSNDGSLGAPWATINKAKDSYAAGDTVIVGPGEYVETVTFTTTGTALNPVVFRAAAKWSARIKGPAGGAGGGRSAVIVTVGDNVDHFTFQHFEVTFAASGGISIGSAVGPNDTINILGNYIHDIGNFCTTTSSGIVGIRFKANLTNFTFDGNRLDDIGRYDHGESGCDTGGNNNWQNHDQGVYGYGDDHKISNNEFRNFKNGWAIQIADLATGWQIVHNTFVGNNPNRSGCIVQDHEGNGNGGHLIANNVCDDEETLLNNVSTACDGTFTATLRNNVIKGTTVTLDENLVSRDGCADYTLSDNLTGQAVMGFVQKTFTSGTASGDFHLLSTSPAVSKALAGHATTDFDGVSRPVGAASDAGAFEFVEAAASTKVGLTAAPGTSILCIGCVIALFPYEIATPDPVNTFQLISCEETNQRYWDAAGYNDPTATYATSPFQLTPAEAVVGTDPVNGWCDPFGEGDTPYQRKETQQ